VQGCRKPSDANNKDATQLVQPTFDATNAPAADTNAPAAATTNPAPAVVVDTNPPPVMPALPVATGAAQEYTIAKGDSFFTVGKKFGVTAKAIQDANPNVQPKKLKIGQKIQIPPAPPAAPSAGTAPAPSAAADTSAGGETYAVKSGDTLGKIAKSYGVSVKALRSANSLTTDKIKVGQKLKIPAKSAAAAPVESTPAPAPVPAPAAGNPGA